MKREIAIEGMTCQNCVNHIKTRLSGLADISNIEVSLTSKSAQFNASSEIELEEIQKVLGGRYAVQEKGREADAINSKSLSTYRPLILIVSFILLNSVLAQYPFDGFSTKLWMRHFMAGFFLSFAFFKFLDLRGFAMAFASYDIIARKWLGWGFIYPFVELALGIGYYIDIVPLYVNALTFIVMSLSLIGVVQTVMAKQKIKCACLGSVFNLPMSEVTIIEDGVMIAMSFYMLCMLL